MTLNFEKIHFIRKKLEQEGLETPFYPRNILDKNSKKKIENYIYKIICLLNLDFNNKEISVIPKRIVKMYTEDIFFGLDYNNFPKMNFIENKMNINEMITISNITLTSICEHHFLIIDGKATVSYIPKNKIIGLSKIIKIVHFFSKRPQIQERLTKQILVTLQMILETKNVAVFIDALHYCIKARDIHDSTSTTITKSFGGIFKSNNKTKQEFLNSVTRF
ncbi:MAG: GTP cyclohydrolase I FolE [Arsenophonus sp.]|nr:MAG: GTP cyclohydrolase I FolE [Arsenophonus sp.]